MGHKHPKKPSNASKGCRTRAEVPGAPESEGTGPDSTVPEHVAEEFWQKSAQGRVSARGFQYQDAVGTWLATRLMTGGLRVDRIIPEGFEDLSCEGGDEWHIQVKSKQERVCDFEVGEAVKHLFEVWRKHIDRRGAGFQGRPMIVWERPVKGESFGEWGIPLRDVLPHEHPIRKGLQRWVSNGKSTNDEVFSLLQEVSCYVLGWKRLRKEVHQAIADQTGVLLGACVPIGHALRMAVSECVVKNNTPAYSERRGLTRTGSARIVERMAGMIDNTSLEEALRDDICEAVDFDTPEEPEGFYSGWNVQPSHVAAGLVADRPDLVRVCVDELNEARPVLVSGPSGVGKSSVMWTVAKEHKKILWYRVRKLREQHISPLVRLLRASGVSEDFPVGLAVDAVGTGAMQVWDRLQAELAAIPGARLIGSVRNEDLLILENLRDCAVVPVELNEAVAERIHAELTARGKTSEPHWRHAYESSEGLTLEFTHYLTHENRLADVVKDQVRQRIADAGREIEFDLLALASVADRWGASLQVSAVHSHLGVSSGRLRWALDRLVDEHLVQENDGRIGGLHQLRSVAIAEAVHVRSSPSISKTVTTVLRVLEVDQIRSFLSGVLMDMRDLDDEILVPLTERLRDDADGELWGEVLWALRVADFRRVAETWVPVLDEHGVAPLNRNDVIWNVLLGGGLTTSIPGFVKPEIAAAVAAILEGGSPLSPLRDELARELGSNALVATLLTCSDFRAAMRLIGALEKSSVDLVPELESAGTDAALTLLLSTCEVAEAAKVLLCMREFGLAACEALINLLGGHEALLDRVRQSWWALLDVGKVEQNGDKVAYARLIHVSDELQGNPDTYVHDITKILLGCFPDCSKSDVRAVRPGGHEIAVGDY